MSNVPTISTARSIRRRFPDSEPNGSQRHQLSLLSQMLTRADFNARLGKSYGTNRDIYTALGYTKTPQYSDFEARYMRQDIAKAIIDAMPKAAWREDPKVKENEDEVADTPFEKAWKELQKELGIYSRMRRVDMMARVGQYAVLLLGFSDTQAEYDLSRPVERGSNLELRWVQPYTQQNADILEYDLDPTSERFNLPELYAINTNTGSGDASKGLSLRVHHERVLHVPGELFESDVFGIPVLQNVLNRLQDVELVAGGSAEAFWRIAFPGMAFIADEMADFDPQTASDFNDEIDEYIHSMKRYLRLQNMKVEKLSPDVASPKDQIDSLLKLISGGTGIPLRMLTGTERGELASSQDMKTWKERVDEHRQDYTEPVILRPLIDKLIDLGVLPEPSDPYWVDWPDLESMSDKDKIEIAKSATEAISKYAGTPGADMVVPVDTYRKKYLGFTDEENKDIENEVEQLMRDEEEQARKDEELQRRMMEQQNQPPNQSPEEGEDE
jgi:phage-related protein (TIGR01555 family)